MGPRDQEALKRPDESVMMRVNFGVLSTVGIGGSPVRGKSDLNPSENGLWGFRRNVEGIWAMPGSAEFLRLDLGSVPL
jgi:hypothetical protein